MKVEFVSPAVALLDHEARDLNANSARVLG